MSKNQKNPRMHSGKPNRPSPVRNDAARAVEAIVSLPGMYEASAPDRVMRQSGKAAARILKKARAQVTMYAPMPGSLDGGCAAAYAFPDGSGLMMRNNAAEDDTRARWDVYATAADAAMQAYMYAMLYGWQRVAQGNLGRAAAT